MGYTGVNLGNVKLSNRSAILKLLNDYGPMSRKDIAAELGLTPATMTLICTDLISAGILLEKGEMTEEKRAGRKKVLVGINYQYRFVLSISIEAAETCITVSDLSGSHTAGRKLKTDGTIPAEQFLKNVSDESKALMWEQGIDRDSILGVGVSVPGPVDRKRGISQHAYRIWNEEIPIGACLKKYLDYPIIVENNVKAYAEGELIYGCGKEQENLLFFKWGPGVGSAIIIQNQVYDGRFSKAAEIGHCIVEMDGKTCRCGRKGCLETCVATHAIAEKVQEACTEETMPELYHMMDGDVSRIEAKNIAQWVRAEDKKLWEVLDEVFKQFVRIAVNTTTILAPDKVIIYGELFNLPHFQERFLHFCKHFDPSYDESYVLKSKLSDRIEYIGPLAVVMNELFLMNDGMQQ